ncbi:outer membrane beta-barrel protein [Muribaculum intestinale]|uniref:outer membrane beta-barrel protein n=1 Tax=Muribaculum intestinale TaxID=1796646 RepID=UPI0025AE1609|nr:outer membrane beta-barrel protein [Muribaculum intestinale]
MKSLKAIMLAGALATAASASAQFANTGSNTASTDLDDYNRISVSYNNTHFGFNKEAGGSDSDFGLNGFGLNYIHGFSVSSTLPMFVETGLNLNFGFGSDTGDKYDSGDYWLQAKNKKQFINLQVPVNFAYKFAIADGVSVSPYLGLNFKFNLVGRMKAEIDYGYDPNEYDLDDFLYEIGVDKVSDLEGDWLSVFSKDDMGSKDATWNRFQMGWHIGAGLQYNAFYLGVEYGTDFIPAFKYEKAKVNSSDLKISLGYCF